MIFLLTAEMKDVIESVCIYPEMYISFCNLVDDNNTAFIFSLPSITCCHMIADMVYLA